MGETTRGARWRKLRADLRSARGRVFLLVAALALSAAAIGTVLGAYEVLDREIETSYRSGRPSEATVELPGGVDAALLAEVRARPGVAAADGREVVNARVRVGGDWKPLKIFVADDPAALQLDLLRPESGAWPPPPGTMALERAATMILGAREGETVLVVTPHGAPRQVAIAGLVHDTGLAPAWQEHMGYAYVTLETLAALGEPPVLHELRASFRPSPASTAEVEARATELAGWLSARGREVHQIRVPPLGRHPHQALMDTAGVALLAFGLLLLLLSAVLIATLLSTILSRQVREIGTMKAIGARTGQLAAMYALLVLAMGLAAFLIALPLGIVGARGFIAAAATMFNIALADPAIPLRVFAFQAAAALLVPLAAAAVPILGATRLTVRDALARHGARSEFVRPAPLLPMAARNALRRPARLALHLGLLAAGGAMAMTAFNIETAYRKTLASLPEMRHDDVEVRFAAPVPVALAAQVAALPGVRAAEPWGIARASLARAGRTDVVGTYPDGGHGSLVVYAPPAGTELVSFPLLAGRWLEPGDRDAAVVNRRLAGSRGLRIGDRIALSVGGAPSTWTVVGIVDELPPIGIYVGDTAFAAATGTEGKAGLLRIAAAGRSDAELGRTIAAIERFLTSRGVAVAAVTPFSRLYHVIEDHLVIFVRLALAMSAVVALVGLLGLAAAMGIAVAERTREIGIMVAIGATGSRIARLVIGEAVLVGAVSGALAVALSLGLTAFLVRLLNDVGALPAPFAVSPGGMAAWLLLALGGSAAASVLPARRAARLTVRGAFAES